MFFSHHTANENALLVEKLCFSLLYVNLIEISGYFFLIVLWKLSHYLLFKVIFYSFIPVVDKMILLPTLLPYQNSENPQIVGSNNLRIIH